MVGAVDGDMAVQTGPVENPVVEHPVDRLAGGRTAACAQFAGMGGIGMTSLAQVGHLGIQERIVRGAMGGMAAQAIFHHRRMIP